MVEQLQQNICSRLTFIESDSFYSNSVFMSDTQISTLWSLA